MGLHTKRATLTLTEEELQSLVQKSNSRTLSKREIDRSNILLLYHQGVSISQIQRQVGISRPSIYKCIDKALSSGMEAGLKDKYHRAKAPVITDEAKLWVINLACTKPKDHGYAAELWTYATLASHTRKQAPKQGHPCLNKSAKATIYRILKSHPIQPHKMNYYLEKRDPEFTEKMEAVLIVYKEVNLINERIQKGEKVALQTVSISLDEKPGVQAIKNIAPDLPPQTGKSKTWSRDYEYKRLGTLSILAAIDLHQGHIIAQVHKRHRSIEFIQLLKAIDVYYPKHQTIQIILDNHSAHISKQTMKYLQSKPNRFKYVHTPKHGSWLNIIETLFSKMSRTFLKNIRVESIEELKERILKGIDEFNQNPVVHRWSKFEMSNLCLL